MECLPVKRESLILSHENNIADYYLFENITLGQGSFGFVKLAKSLQDFSKKAIKVIPKKRIRHPELLKNEISVMKQINHPNIIQMYETFEDRHYIYLALEYCEGGELFDKIIEIKHFSEQSACILFEQILSAVSYLHSSQIVHRDLKPENFLFSSKKEDSKLKLIDFGLSKSYKKNEKLQTRSGTCMYMAPEVIAKEGYDEKCDVWSIGVILYMMLCGYAPFDGETDRDILRSVMNQSLSFDGQVWEGVSEDAKDLIFHLLDKNPITRFTASEAFSHPWLANVKNSNNIALNLDLNRLTRYQNSIKFRKTVLNYMATQCSSEEIAEFADLFMKIDKNKDGTLSLLEIQAALSENEISKPELEQLIKCIDTDASGGIDFTEFVASIMDRGIYMCQEKLWNAFKRFDIYDAGRISSVELHTVLDQENIVKDPAYWANIIKEADTNGDGTIDFCEFVEMMQQGPLGRLNSFDD